MVGLRPRQKNVPKYKHVRQEADPPYRIPQWKKGRAIMNSTAFFIVGDCKEPINVMNVIYEGIWAANSIE